MTLGIDIGGTNLSLGLVHQGEHRKMFSTPSFAPDATLEQTLDYLCAQIEKIITPETEKIGIGVPTVVDVKRGIVYDAQNIPSWKEVPLKSFLENRFGVPVAVNNDANCYAMGIYGLYPADAKPELLVAVTLGTGVGIGIVNEGRLLCGANCGAGELGCLHYRDSIIEDYCSKKYFTARGWDSKQAAEAARAGNAEALALFDEMGRHLGALLCAVMYAYDPSHVAFGGGVANNHSLFEPSMMDHLRKHFPYQKAVDRLQVDYFTENNIPVIGASLI